MGDWAATGDALFALGELSFPGEGSVDYILRSARLGNPSAQHLLALMHAVGFPHPEVKQSTATAVVYDHFASTAGHGPASKSLGYRAMFSQGVPRSCAHALVYYKRAASIVASTHDIHSHIPTYPRLPELLDAPSAHSTRQDFDKLLFLASAATKTRNGATLHRIAKLLLAQQTPPPDYKFVRKLLHQAFEWGHLAAAAQLGRLHAHGWGVPINTTRARDFFLMAPENDAEALHGLGLLNLEAGMYDGRLALHYFQAASKLGHLNSIYHAATLLTAIAPQQSRRYFEAASKSGHVLATFKFAEIMERSNEITTPFEAKCTAVVALYKRVAESVAVPLMDTALAKFQTRDYTAAYYLYRLAAEEGSEVAQTNAAFLIQRGYVTEPSSAYAQLELALASYANADYAEAMTLYSDLVSQTKFLSSTTAYVFVSPALFTVGYMYEMGYGVPQDRRKALEHYTRLTTRVYVSSLEYQDVNDSSGYRFSSAFLFLCLFLFGFLCTQPSMKTTMSTSSVHLTPPSMGPYVSMVHAKCQQRRKLHHTLTIIPSEVSNEILSYLDAQSLAAASVVCSSWHELTGESNAVLWKLVFRRDMHEDGRRFHAPLNGRVYDIGAFLYLHPGGHRVLADVIGTDATDTWFQFDHSSGAQDHMKELEVPDLFSTPWQGTVAGVFSARQSVWIRMTRRVFGHASDLSALLNQFRQRIVT
ncbi:hypothetical protein DYB32_005085 [Aphanomyces invadans]|uniref:Cytochrome b5 heme-binding domain-containing protein n=1 Tax=Aphanomyces invadans TaxID=157072 RepID=A0A3R6VX23_9STRA|nr:hypothetical protein DYB32_005085 [Aphanomyces invadans]